MKEYKLRIDGKPFDVKVIGISGSVAEVSVDGASYKVEIGGTASEAAAPAQAPAAAPAPARAAASVPAPPAAGGRAVRSPLPGVILSVSVKEGQKVTRGQSLAVIEAMKMENDILAPCDGTVAAVMVERGDSVAEGAVILNIG